MKWINNLMTVFKEAGISLFSNGKFSMKRLLSFIFAGAVLYMVRAVVSRIIPAENQNLFMHVYDGLLMLIGTLLIGATWQDVAKNKVKQTGE